MNLVDPLKDSEVRNARTLCGWATAAYGVPPPTQKDIQILNKKARDLFEAAPGTDWQTIVRVVKWCHQHKRRYGRIWSYVGQYRFAWADGAIELPVDETLADEINRACEQEADLVWRTRLRRAVGDYRRDVLSEWQRSRASTTQSS